MELTDARSALQSVRQIKAALSISAPILDAKYPQHRALILCVYLIEALETLIKELENEAIRKEQR